MTKVDLFVIFLRPVFGSAVGWRIHVCARGRWGGVRAAGGGVGASVGVGSPRAALVRAVVVARWRSGCAAAWVLGPAVGLVVCRVSRALGAPGQSNLKPQPARCGNLKQPKKLKNLRLPRRRQPKSLAPTPGAPFLGLWGSVGLMLSISFL